VVRSESDQSGYPMNHPSNRRISIRSDYPSDWSDGSSDIRMDPSSDWADGSLLSDGWVSHFFLFKKKKSGYPVNLIWSDQSDGSSPAKKKTGLRSIRSIRSIRSDPIYPMAHHRLSAAWTFWAGWSRHVIIRLTDWSVSSGSHLYSQQASS